MKKLKTFKPTVEEVKELQNNVKDVLDTLLPIDILNGYLPKDARGSVISYDILATDTVINHGLAREYTGYLIIDKDANANIWTSATVNNLKTRQIILIASSPVTAKIFFF